MLYFLRKRYRVIAHDRRGHGRSSQTWTGNEMDICADDLAALTEALDPKDAIQVGRTTCGGEMARHLGRHGTNRVAKAGPKVSPRLPHGMCTTHPEIINPDLLAFTTD